MLLYVALLLLSSIFFPYLQKNKKGSLQIICEYYELHYPGRGCSVKFHPLEHLHPMEYHRSGETVLHVAGSTIDPRSCSTSLELAEVILVIIFRISF